MPDFRFWVRGREFCLVRYIAASKPSRRSGHKHTTKVVVRIIARGVPGRVDISRYFLFFSGPWMFSIGVIESNLTVGPWRPIMDNRD